MQHVLRNFRGLSGSVKVGAKPVIRIRAPVSQPGHKNNYVGEVGEMCQKTGHPPPEYTTYAQAAETGPEWVCIAELTIADELLKEEHSAPNKMDAKQKAAQHLKHKLQAALNATAKEAEASAGAANYKGQLQEVLNKVIGSRHYPYYTDRKEGPDDCPVFTAQVTVKVEDQSITVQGDPENTRRKAEHAAARKFLLEHIIMEP